MKLYPRFGAPSIRWRNLVLRQAGIDPKDSKKSINKFVDNYWFAGYSHKKAAIKLSEYLSVNDPCKEG